MVVLSSPWSPDNYLEFLSRLRDSSVRWVSLTEYASGNRGLWLRHDVEVDIDAAVRMAQLENKFGLAACYYFCVDSPLISLPDNLLAQRIMQIERLGHTVSFHVILAGRSSVAEQLLKLESRFPGINPESLTFHAPGRELAALAALPMGAEVYEPVVTQGARYYSDSTGRWRWGYPLDDSGIAEISAQLLVHPFWWSGQEIRVDPEAARLVVPLRPFRPRAFARQSLIRDGDPSGSGRPLLRRRPHPRRTGRRGCPSRSPCAGRAGQAATG
jgi:hypothetical protein